MKTNSNQQILLQFFVYSDILADCLLSRSFLYEYAIFQWNSVDIEFFDFYFNDKTITTVFVIKHSEKSIYFKNIHFFLEKCSDIAITKDEQFIKNNLFTCFRELTLQWYISEMIANVKILIKYASNINRWTTKLLKRFEKKPQCRSIRTDKREVYYRWC